MKKIEAEWNITPKSGLTQISLTDLNCNSIQEWELLNIEEQKKRIEVAIPEYDLCTVKFIVSCFYEVEEDE